MPLSKGQKKKAKAKRKQVRKDEHMATNMTALDKAHQLRDHLIDTKYNDGTAESSLKAWGEAVDVHSKHFTQIDMIQFEMDKHQQLYDINYKQYEERLTIAPMLKLVLLCRKDISDRETKKMMDTMDARVKHDKCYLEHCKIMVEFWKLSKSVHENPDDNHWNLYMLHCKEFHKRMLDNSTELDEAYSDGVRVGLYKEEEYNTAMKQFANELSMMNELAVGHRFGSIAAVPFG
tara:strand:+ start:893 stop:1591 length:699 start_codon:yes stop_codon:yes gene_type:complete